MTLTKNLMHSYQNEMVAYSNAHVNTMMWAFLGSGKMQPLSEPILTPEGWKTMGDIKKGDYVIGSDGLPKLVTNTTNHFNKQIYKVSFNDGSSTDCGGEHLWSVRSPYFNKIDRPYRTLSTLQILQEGVCDSVHSNIKNHSIPLIDPIDVPDIDLDIEPYLLGVILGDGTISKYGGVTLCTDIEIIEKCNTKLLRLHDTCKYIGYSSIPNINSAITKLKLQKCRSWEKFIPNEYLHSSPGQRLSLLQGLLDTDAHAYKGQSGVEFSSTSENLIDGVVQLTQSLGGIGRKSKPRVTHCQTGKGRVSWRVHVKLPVKLNPFRLSRKKNQYKKPSKYPCRRYISSIVKNGFDDCRCISIDSKDKLYVTKNYILTHNSICTLTSIVDRMNAGQVKKVLILAPLRVCYAVWEKEAMKWEHTKHLTFSIIHGNPEKRRQAFFKDADIYLINYEGLVWLTEMLMKYYPDQLPYEMCVYDEVSCIKNSESVRMKTTTKREVWDKKLDLPVLDEKGRPKIIIKKGWRNICHKFLYTIGLTGTPSSNGYIDLFGQYLAVDGGQRLFSKITHFRDAYFKQDYSGFGYIVTDMGRHQIERKIADITLSMNDASKYLDLPRVTVKDMFVQLPKKSEILYKKLEDEMYMALDSGTEVEVFNRAALSNKCLQVAAGDCYTDLEGSHEHLHDAKFEALDEVMEEAAGSPVLVLYNFTISAKVMMKRYKKYKPVNLTAEKASNTASIVKKWNEGKIRMIVAHSASCGHGIDGLQDSGSIVCWFGINWNLEYYLQTNGRIDRQGQTKPVSIIRILTENTVDIAVALAIDMKYETQEGLKNAIQQYRKGKREPNLIDKWFMS